ncbi:hypothetical protein GCM10020331_064680 [Ectobacillus funiculus]
MQKQDLTGGTNGLTNFSTAFGFFSLSSPLVQIALYILTVFVLALAFWVYSFMTNSRFGRVLMAIRDGENRVRFSWL